MTDSPDNLVEARRQIASMCRKLEGALQTLREKAAEGRRLKPQITLAERRIQALQVALRCLDNAIHNCGVADHFFQHYLPTRQLEKVGKTGG